MNTVTSSDVTFKDEGEAFEDGTVNFQGIIGVMHGIETWSRLGIRGCDTCTHVFNLARYLANQLNILTYSTGRAVVKIYSDFSLTEDEQESTVPQ